MVYTKVNSRMQDINPFPLDLGFRENNMQSNTTFQFLLSTFPLHRNGVSTMKQTYVNKNYFNHLH